MGVIMTGSSERAGPIKNRRTIPLEPRRPMTGRPMSQRVPVCALTYQLRLNSFSILMFILHNFRVNAGSCFHAAAS